MEQERGRRRRGGRGASSDNNGMAVIINIVVLFGSTYRHWGENKLDGVFWASDLARTYLFNNTIMTPPALLQKLEK